MSQALEELLELMDLEELEVNIFRGRSPQEDRQRVFGGQVLGQALVAAIRTVEEPGRIAHSMHGYFLRPGDPNIPILYDVDRIRAASYGHAMRPTEARFVADEILRQLPGLSIEQLRRAGSVTDELIDGLRKAGFAES
jgi:hypothetical protein